VNRARFARADARLRPLPSFESLVCLRALRRAVGTAWRLRRDRKETVVFKITFEYLGRVRSGLQQSSRSR
jgi:hypothetical protein